MSDDPPVDGTDGDEPVVDEVLDQLDAALTEAGVTDPGMKRALSENLRAALGRLGELGEVDLTVDVVSSGPAGLSPDAGDGAGDDVGDGAGDSDGAGPPEVTVVDGGRSRGQPRILRPRPQLRVADGDRSGSDSDDGRPSAGTDPVSTGPVRIVRGSGRGQLSHQGRIDVPADGRQAIYRGPHGHPYRVLCAQGRLAVSVDGVTVETLSPGQSLDVEGTVIVILAADETAATGAYARL